MAELLRLGKGAQVVSPAALKIKEKLTLARVAKPAYPT